MQYVVQFCRGLWSGKCSKKKRIRGNRLFQPGCLWMRTGKTPRDERSCADLHPWDVNKRDPDVRSPVGCAGLYELRIGHFILNGVWLEETFPLNEGSACALPCLILLLYSCGLPRQELVVKHRCWHMQTWQQPHVVPPECLCVFAYSLGRNSFICL